MTRTDATFHIPRAAVFLGVAFLVGYLAISLIVWALDRWDHRPVVNETIISRAAWGGVAGNPKWSGPDIYCIAGRLHKRENCGWPKSDPDPEKWVTFWQETKLGKFPVAYSFLSKPTERPGGWSSFRNWCLLPYEPRGTITGTVTHECSGKKVGPWEFMTHEITPP